MSGGPTGWPWWRIREPDAGEQEIRGRSSNHRFIDLRKLLAALTTVLVVVLLPAAAGAIENKAIDPGVGAPATPGGSIGGPEGGAPPASDPASPAPPEELSSDEGAVVPEAPAASGATQPAARTSDSAPALPEAKVTHELGDVTAAPIQARPFRIVTPARPASDDSPVGLPTTEPFGVVLAAAVLLLIGAGAGNAWAHASGRLDTVI